MAASCRHVGRHIQRNSRFLLNNYEYLWGHRGFSHTHAVGQQMVAATESTEAIVIPRKKTWSKEAVLQALASTVSRDPTASQYRFQDDSYLAPRTPSEFKIYTLSQEAGRTAAKFFVDGNPKFFTKDFAEPHIPCLMPVSVRLDEVSEDALRERINLRKVTAAVDMYDQLLQSGTAVSMEMTCDLLDLICLYGDKDPIEEGVPEREVLEEPAEEEGGRIRRGRVRRQSDLQKPVWKDNNNAERIFNLLPERNTRCYSALIRGMVKHGAYEKAYSRYEDMLNNRMTADVHIYNALISAAPELRERYIEKWDLVTELLKHMSQQKIQPNLLTFNSTLKALRRCGTMAKNPTLHTLSEMKALGIAPSLATFDHVLAIFYKAATVALGPMDILQEIMSEMGDTFTCQDPDDVLFFSSAMRVCLNNKDMDQAYVLHSLMEKGDNWKLLGDVHQNNIYYGRFFSLLCMMQHIDVVMEWYRKLIPSLYYPNVQGMKDLLQALDTDSRLDLLPTIWKDIKSMGHDNKTDLVEELLELMARERHSPEVQESFAVCALDVKSKFMQDRSALEWSNFSLSHITSLLLHANRTTEAWGMLELFKKNNRIPDARLLQDFLSVYHGSGAAKSAVEVVQLSAAFCLPATPGLAQRVLKDFDLTDEQRHILSELSVEPTD